MKRIMIRAQNNELAMIVVTSYRSQRITRKSLPVPYHTQCVFSVARSKKIKIAKTGFKFSQIWPNLAFRNSQQISQISGKMIHNEAESLMDGLIH